MKRHLTDGELRAALDGELDAQRLGHLDRCADCLARQNRLQAEQTQTADRLAFLAPANDPTPAPQKAWARLSQRLLIKKEISMFVVNNFLMSIAQLLDFLLTVYMWIIIGRVIISWVNADPYNPIVRFLYEATEPLLSRIRRMLPLSFGGIDFSPMILILAIMFVQSFLIQTLKQLAVRMG